MKEYKYYFFDLFHTLIRIEPYADEKHREHALLGLTQSEWSSLAESDYTSRALGIIKKPQQVIETILSHMDSPVSKETAQAVYNVRCERFRKAFLEVEASILDTIKELKKRNKVLVLVSNADVFDTLYWNESPLYIYFDSAVFSCDAGHMKPDIKIYKAALESVQADISKSVFIGDGGHNELSGAKKAGFETVLTKQIIISCWPGEIPRLSKTADYVVDNLSELLHY